MIKVNIHEAKTHLSKYLEKVAEGETIVVCKRNVPIAEIRPITTVEKKPRQIGFDKGKFTVPDEFFDPLPDELLEYFDGRKG
jgi:prevent-host-death family protein